MTIPSEGKDQLDEEGGGGGTIERWTISEGREQDITHPTDDHTYQNTWLPTLLPVSQKLEPTSLHKPEIH